MDWSVEFVRSAERQISRVDRIWQERILDYLDDLVATSDNPRVRGKPLSGDLNDLWRYRVGDYRIICELNDAKRSIIVLKIGHRRSIYR